MEAKKGKTLSGLLVVLLVSSLLAGINVLAQEEAPEEQAPQVPLFGAISGDIRDMNNRPIKNVTVYLTNETITSFEEALAAGLALVGPDVSKIFPQEDEEGALVVVPRVAGIEQKTHEDAYYALENVPPGTYTVNARALREDGRMISGRAVNIVVDPLVTTTVDMVLDVPRPVTMVVTAYPTEASAQTFQPIQEPILLPHPILKYGAYVTDTTLIVRQGRTAGTGVVWWVEDDEPLPKREDCKVEIRGVTDEKGRDIPFPEGIKITYYGPGDVEERIYKRGSKEYREWKLSMNIRFNVSVDTTPGTYIFHVVLRGFEAHTERPRSIPGRPMHTRIVLVVFDKDTTL